jgi:hypothetical protein
MTLSGNDMKTLLEIAKGIAAKDTYTAVNKADIIYGLVMAGLNGHGDDTNGDLIELDALWRKWADASMGAK